MGRLRNRCRPLKRTRLFSFGLPSTAVLVFTMTPLKGAGVRRSGTGSTIQNFTGLHLVSEDGRAGLYYDALKGAGVRRSGTGSTVQNFTGLHWVLQDLRAGVYDATATRLMRCWLHLHHSSQNFVTGSHCVGYVLMPLRGYFACCPVLQSSCETPQKAAALKQVFKAEFS